MTNHHLTVMREGLHLMARCACEGWQLTFLVVEGGATCERLTEEAQHFHGQHVERVRRGVTPVDDKEEVT